MLGQPNPCYLAFTTSDAAISGLIKKFDGGRFSHVAFLYKQAGRWTIIHSDFPKIHNLYYEEWLVKGNKLVELWAFPSTDLFSGILACSGDIGKAYDYAGLIGQISVKFWRLFGRKTKNPHDGATWFCSEWACARVLPAAGVKLPMPNGSGAVSPGDLRDALTRYPAAGIAPLDVVTR